MKFKLKYYLKLIHVSKNFKRKTIKTDLNIYYNFQGKQLKFSKLELYKRLSLMCFQSLSDPRFSFF